MKKTIQLATLAAIFTLCNTLYGQATSSIPKAKAKLISTTTTENKK